MKFKFLIFCGLTLVILLPPAAQAYLDEILTTPNEVWEAARSVLKPENIKSENMNTYTLKTRWQEDYVRKERTLLPDAIGRGPKLSRTVKRRYSMTIQLNELKTGTQVQITGKYQERPFGAPEHQSRWKNIKPTTEDYELERILFFRILTELTRLRTTQS